MVGFCGVQSPKDGALFPSRIVQSPFFDTFTSKAQVSKPKTARAFKQSATIASHVEGLSNRGLSSNIHTELDEFLNQR